MTLETRLMPNLTGQEAQPAGFDRRRGMLCFVLAHLLENGSGFLIPGWQLAEVIVQVLADLVFGRRDKAETDAVADQPGRAPMPKEGHRNRVEHTGWLPSWRMRCSHQAR